MCKLILIETSTALCSTALVIDGKIACTRESSMQHAHASMTTPFIKEMLDEKGMRVQDFDAVCLSSGPGSYTGLRVGSSTAKGLCFAAGIPLVSVGTLELLVHQAAANGLSGDCRYVIPMIDARRMEVYTAVFNPDGTRVSEIEPKVIDPESFRAELEEGKVLFIGDGAAKCKDTINHANACFVQTYPHASAMLKPAMREFEAGNFQDTAYFEPFYLKQFVATISKKNLF